SKGPDFSDPKAVLKEVNEAAKAAYLTPEELRKLASRGFGTDFEKIDADWTQRPLQLTVAGIAPAQSSAQQTDEGSDKANTRAGQDSDKPKSDDDDITDIKKEAERLIALSKQIAHKGWIQVVQDEDAPA